jgi:AcrR family transcriptional regulator
MASVENVKPARERILDAAAAVMHNQGLANATTKAIAARAGYSEAMLYKHFADKQELFLLVLKERMPGLRPRLTAAGTGDLATNLQGVVTQLMDYFADLFPMSVSIFSAPDLLAQHRDGVARHGGIGPTAPIRLLAGYLDEERLAGRIRKDADTNAAASLLVGMAFHQGFLASFGGESTVEGAAEIAASAVAIVLPGLL